MGDDEGVPQESELPELEADADDPKELDPELIGEDAGVP